MAVSEAKPERIHSPRLAILIPRWGAPSETFVRRHVSSLAPGRTVVATHRNVSGGAACPDVPLLRIRETRDFPTDRIARIFGQWRFDRRARALRSFLIEQKINVVMAEWLNFSAQWFASVRDLGLRFFAHAHGYDVTRKALQDPWHRFLYRHLAQMNGVITVSQLTRQRLLDTCRLDPDRVHVIPCGVDVPATLTQRAESDEVVCLHIGRLVEKKGPMITVKAFHQAWREFPRLRLEMIGDGPFLEECQRYCQEQGISNVVTFHGAKPHEFVKERLARADIFLLHSITAQNGDEEGLPVAILEGMAYALPVISTRHAGIPEAVLDEKTGLLVSENDVAAMSRKMIDLARQPGLRAEMGEAGRSRVEEMFSADQETKRLQALLFG
jgi:glycosyltransferase involved in cell wall biosynthesis